MLMHFWNRPRPHLEKVSGDRINQWQRVPYLAVERNLGKAGLEEVRRVKEIALTRVEILPIPIGAREERIDRGTKFVGESLPHAVEFLTHPPAGRIDVFAPCFSKKDFARFATHCVQ